ncbi:hypothetical protein ACHWQZ_G014335 [Mnemiopsis leidyi]
MQDPDLDCPGRYCGRYLGECTACPRGMRVNVTSKNCEDCKMDPETYEWLYLGFMVLVVIYFHMESLTRFLEKACGECDVRSTSKWICVTLLETMVAAFLTLILSDPHGQLQLYGCGVRSFLDWYSVFQNPSEKFVETIYCDSEVVYPLFSIVYKFLGFCLIMMILIKSWYKPTVFTTSSVYATLYFIPGIALLHGLLCGVIYYSFPYLCISGSLLLTAILMSEHLEDFTDIVDNIKKAEFMSQILMYWVLHGYGILSIVTYNHLSHWYLLLTPLPTVFYVVTLPFSIPIVQSMNEEIQEGGVRGI